MNASEFFGSAETSNTEASQEPVKPVEKEVEESVENNSEKEEVTSQESTQKKERGVERRIAQLTAKYKSDIENLTKTIEELKSKVQQPEQSEQEERSIETIDDLKAYLLEEMKKTVGSELSTHSQKLLEEKQKKEVESLTTSFSDKVMDKYSNMFEDGDFIGTDSQRHELAAMVDLFNYNPKKWTAWIDKHGIDKFNQFVNGKFEVEEKKTKLDKMLDISDKTRTAKASTGNAVDYKEVPKFKNALSFFNNAIMKG